MLGRATRRGGFGRGTAERSTDHRRKSERPAPDLAKALAIAAGGVRNSCRSTPQASEPFGVRRRRRRDAGTRRRLYFPGSFEVGFARLAPDGRVAQRESAAFTRQRPQVRNLPRPLRSGRWRPCSDDAGEAVVVSSRSQAARGNASQLETSFRRQRAPLSRDIAGNQIIA